MVKAEQATVYRGGGRRWLTLKAACNAEARAKINENCDCSPGDDFVCGLHEPETYPVIIRRLARMHRKAYEQRKQPRGRPVIKVKLLNENAKAPTKGTPGSAGFDLYAIDDATIWPGSHVKIPTGVSVQISPGSAGFIWPRSGLATKHGFDLLAGLVDSDYRGEVHVCGINHGERPIEVKSGDRIAQLVVSPVETVLEVVSDLEDPKTRNGGFGSTGI